MRKGPSVLRPLDKSGLPPTPIILHFVDPWYRYSLENIGTFDADYKTVRTGKELATVSIKRRDLAITRFSPLKSLLYTF